MAAKGLSIGVQIDGIVHCRRQLVARVKEESPTCVREAVYRSQKQVSLSGHPGKVATEVICNRVRLFPFHEMSSRFGIRPGHHLI